MAAQRDTPLCLCVALAIVAIKYAAAADPMAPRPQHEVLPPEDSLRRHMLPPEDSLRRHMLPPEDSLRQQIAGQQPDSTTSPKTNDYEATINPHLTSYKKDPKRYSIVDSLTDLNRISEKRRGLMREAVESKSKPTSTWKPHPWRRPIPAMLVPEERVRRAVAETEAPTAKKPVIKVLGGVHDWLQQRISRLQQPSATPPPANTTRVQQPMSNAQQTTRKPTVETTTQDRSIITAPLKSCPEGQRMGPNRNCVDNFTDPEGSD